MESEALSYHYELDLRPSPAAPILEPDPRVAHTLNLSFDELGNVQQSIVVGYPRWREHEDSTLTGQRLALIGPLLGKTIELGVGVVMSARATDVTWTRALPAANVATFRADVDDMLMVCRYTVG